MSENAPHNDSVLRDSKKIDEMIKNHLKKVKSIKGGWLTLYKHNSKDEYWEKFYPDSEAHGGGAPALKKVSSYYVKENYGNA